MQRFEYRNLMPAPDAEKAYLGWIEHLHREFASRSLSSRTFSSAILMRSPHCDMRNYNIRTMVGRGDADRKKRSRPRRGLLARGGDAQELGVFVQSGEVIVRAGQKREVLMEADSGIEAP